MGATSPRVIIGLTGASGQTFGTTAIEVLAESSVEVHLIMSSASAINLRHEGQQTPDELREIADVTYMNESIDADVGSPTFRARGMLVAPCSMKTLAAIANGLTPNLISQAAASQLDRGAPVVIMPREKPLNLIHLRNIRRATERGTTVIPPLLDCSGLDRDANIDTLVQKTVGRALNSLEGRTE